MGKQEGFTLIELMITVVVVAILATIAVPSYRDYVLRGRIVAGTAMLADARVRAEQFFQDNRTFVGLNASGVGVCAQTRDNFTLNCSNLTATTYTLTAAGGGPAAGFTYTVDQANARATTSVPSGWNTNATCWVIKKGGVC